MSRREVGSRTKGTGRSLSRPTPRWRKRRRWKSKQICPTGPFRL